MIQELVTNVIKHSDADKLLIQLTEHETFLNILVEDDGGGFDKNKEKEGFGLKNVRKRLNNIAAEFEFSSSANGTFVLINVPL